MVDRKNKYNLDSENELDTLFEEVKNKKFKKAIRRAKRFSTMKIVFICVSIIIVLGIGTRLIGEYMAEKNLSMYMRKMDNYSILGGPNEFAGMNNTYKTWFSGKSEYKTFKHINEKRVYTGSHGIEYNLFGIKHNSGNGALISETKMTEEEVHYLPRYNDMGQKLMEFYYPYVNYGDKYKNDLRVLDDIDDNKYMEMAISFDKAYSIDEVNKMIPDSIKLTWYWIDIYDDLMKENQKYHINKQEDGLRVEQYPDICYENSAFGFKTINEYGEKIDKPEERFINFLKDSEMIRIYDKIAGEDKKLTEDDIKVQGIVVIGDAENLRELRNMPFIKASSIGIITDKY